MLYLADKKVTPVKRLLVVGLIVLLGGCQAYQGDVNSPFFAVPSGSQLILNRSLTVSPERVAVYLQDGQAYDGLPNTYNPYCKFEVSDKKATAQQVKPDTFRIYNSTRHWTISMTDSRPAVRRVSFLGDNTQGGPSFKIYASYFYLRSARQPQVLKMTCEYWGDPVTGHFLSVNQIRQALGDIFTLRLGPQL